jgi:rhomboid family GlyGly-CTERM serine protease
VIAGQWWRLLSCHFVHLNASHWLANMVATLLIGMLVSWRPNVRLMFVIGVTVCFLTSLLIHLLWPYVSWYAGLSGVLHGLLVLVGAARKDAVGVAVLLLLLVKLSAGQMMAMGPWMASSIPVLQEGHLAGALAGVIVLMMSTGAGGSIMIRA